MKNVKIFIDISKKKPYNGDVGGKMVVGEFYAQSGQTLADLADSWASDIFGSEQFANLVRHSPSEGRFLYYSSQEALDADLALGSWENAVADTSAVLM